MTNDFVHKPSKAALAHAKETVGAKAFKSNKDVVQSIAEDFDAGAAWAKAWISVDERMPEHDGPVLILAYSDDARTPIWRRVHVAIEAQFGWNTYMDENEEFWGADEVTHWQELPALPKS